MVSLQAARGTRYAPLTITPAAEFETLSMRYDSKSGIATAAHLIGWHMMRNLVSPVAYVRYAPQPGADRHPQLLLRRGAIPANSFRRTWQRLAALMSPEICRTSNWRARSQCHFKRRGTCSGYYF